MNNKRKITIVSYSDNDFKDEVVKHYKKKYNNKIIITEGKTDAKYLRNIFAHNLNKYMDEYGKTNVDISKDLKIKYSTVRDWSAGKTYPRVDKIQLLANYFNILTSNLTEETVNNIIPVLGSIPARYTY